MIPNHLLDFIFRHILIDVIDERLISRRILPCRYRFFSLSLIVLAFQFIEKVVCWRVSSDILDLLDKVAHGLSLPGTQIFGRKVLGHVSGYLLDIRRSVANVTLFYLDHIFIWNLIDFAVALEKVGIPLNDFGILIESIGDVVRSRICSTHENLATSNIGEGWSPAVGMLDSHTSILILLVKWSYIIEFGSMNIWKGSELPHESFGYRVLSALIHLELMIAHVCK